MLTLTVYACLRLAYLSAMVQVLLGFSACDGYPYQRNSQKQCPGGGKLPTPRKPSSNTDCDGREGHESPFICDVRLPGLALPSSDYYNASRIPLPYHFETVAGTIVVDARKCSQQGTNRCATMMLG